jgi:protein gp37
MAENSKIEWCHHSGNLWWGCTEVHAGCDNCYARVFSHRYDGGKTLWGNDAPRRFIKSIWKDLAKFQRQAKKEGVMKRVFVGSMMDIFEKPMPLLNSPYTHLETTDDLRQELFTRITWGENEDGSRGLYPNLMFLFLTKRPSNIAKYVPAGWLEEPPPNVMYGTSIVDQATAKTLVPQLLKVKGKKFLSIEPQLDSVYLEPNWLINNPFQEGQIDWVIQGGESGHHKRPFNLDWARAMRDQCAEFGVPYFFKQIDKIKEIPEDLMIRQFPL